MLIGYARTSTTEQLAGLEAQIRDLSAVGCSEKIFREQVSSVATRDQLTLALDFVREGDTLVVTRLDRLARSTTDLLTIVAKLERKGVGLKVLDCGGGEIDTKSPSGRLIVTLFGAFGQFERELLLSRQREGIAKAKLAGKYRGRAPTARAKLTQICQLKAEGLGAGAISERTGVSRASVYRLLAEQAA